MSTDFGQYHIISDQEIDALVRGYTDEQLLQNYGSAAKQSGTTWQRTLLAEVRRRGLDAPA